MTDAYHPLPDTVEWRTPFDLLARNVALYPNKLALVASSSEGKEERLSYAALAHAIDRAADGLRSYGLRRGDHVAILMTNCAAAEYVMIAWGAMRLGAVVVPLNARFAVPELLAAIEDMDCRYLVHETGFDETVSALTDRTDQIEGRCIRVGKDGDWAKIYEAGQALGGGFPDLLSEDLADILLTSGTTGRSKGVMLTHGNAVATGAAIAGGLDLGPQDTYQSPFPLFTSSGFHFNLMAAWWAGATMVIETEVDLEATLARMTRERTTVYCAVPAVYIFMLDAFDSARHDLSSMRVFDYGGAPMAQDVIRRLAKIFPHVELRQTYGLTEAGPSGTFLAGRDALRKLGSLGTPMPMCDVRVMRPDGTETDPDEMGEVVMRGPAVSQGYYKRPDANAEAFRDGWLWTGDLARRDADGYLFYMDRKKDVIIRGGYNITSMEVEDAIFEHPSVEEVAVVSVPHEKLGEDICAFVVLRKAKPTTREELMEFLSARIADYKIPRRWVFVPELPRNPTGKILKNELRERARNRAL